MKYKYLLLLLLMLPFASGCERSDDVVGIFTGKTWKLTYITLADNRKPHPYNFWGNTDTYDKAIKEMNKEGAYLLSFQGAEVSDITSGTFSGVLGTPLTYSGKWSADGKSNDFNASVEKSGGNKALLDSYFIDGIENATRYEGDYQNLFLYYTYKGIELCLTFHVVN